MITFKNTRFFNWLKGSEPAALLLQQRYVDLHASFERVKVQVDPKDKVYPLIDKIDELFASYKNWDNANQIEQLLINFYSESHLKVCFQIRVLDAERKLSDSEAKFYRSLDFDQLDYEGKRELVSGLVRKLQWVYDVENIGKDYTIKTRIRTSILFILSIFIFFIFDKAPAVSRLFNIQVGDKGYYILTAMAAGCMGASLSMLIRLKNKIAASTLANLKLVHRYDYLLSRALVGMVSGLLLFYAFQAEVLQGSFFPEISFKVSELIDDKNFALLIFWCFISGFSETFIPDLLTKAESKNFDGKKGK